MTTYVALLRAVNVGTANRFTMDRLRAAFVAGGYPDAVTYIQSGNVIFDSRQSAALIKADVEALITENLGLSITAVIRSADLLAEVCSSNPFLVASGADGQVTKLHVAFLEASPTPAAVAAFESAAASTGDEVSVIGDDVFIRYAKGAGVTKLTPTVWRNLAVQATARNWTVTNKLAELAAAHSGG